MNLKPNLTVLTAKELKTMNTEVNEEMNELLRKYRDDQAKAEAVLHTLVKYGIVLVLLLVIAAVTQGAPQ